MLIIGGSDAGISAALRIRELDPQEEVTLVVADAFANYSICGLPFYLSGEVGDWRRLAHRTQDELEGKGLKLLLNHTAQEIDPLKRLVKVVDKAGLEKNLSYNRLLIATGATPSLPQISGVHEPGVFPLHTMEDSFQLNHFLTEQRPRSAIIIGGGYIGLEMADALTYRGLKVTLIGRTTRVLPTVDQELGALVEKELGRHKVEVINQITVESIERVKNKLVVKGSGGFLSNADLVLVATGVRPSSRLGTHAGVLTTSQGALCVNRKMETNVPGIYAAGDCVETWHHLLQTYVYLPLGTTAHKQGRVAGENIAGGNRSFMGSLGTQVVKVFELTIARTGLRDQEALQAGFDPLTVELETWDHKAYYPNPHNIHIRVTGDRQTGRLLGAQMLGHWHSEVAKRIDVFATALYHQMKVEELNNLDLSYTPPFSSPWDPVQLSAQAWTGAR